MILRAFILIEMVFSGAGGSRNFVQPTLNINTLHLFNLNVHLTFHLERN